MTLFFYVLSYGHSGWLQLVCAVLRPSPPFNCWPSSAFCQSRSIIPDMKEVELRTSSTSPLSGHLYCISKMSNFLFFNNCQKLTNFNIFGTWNPDKILFQQLIDLPISPVSCRHCYLGKSKVIFQSAWTYGTHFLTWKMFWTLNFSDHTPKTS